MTRSAISPPRYEPAALALLILTYLLVGALYATQTPAWQVPDEPAHYNYIAQLAENGCCPVLAMGDYDQHYLSELTSARFAPAVTGRLGAVQYEDHQPPLYYLLAWPVFALTGGDLTALRLFSVVIGAGVAAMAWATARALFPTRPWYALTTAAFVAFVPQHTAMLAGVNNDALAELWIGAALLACVLYRRGGEDGLPQPHPAILGALAGLAGLTKTTGYFVVVIALAAVFLRWRRVIPSSASLASRLRSVVPLTPADLRPASPLPHEARGPESAHPQDISPLPTVGEGAGGEGKNRAGAALRPLLIAALWVILVAAAVNLPWWLRNAATYGGLDIAGLGRHDAVVVGQPRTADWIADNGLGGLLSRFVQFTFNSFWGQFGWMAAPMPGWIYAGLLAFTGAALAGLALALARNQRKQEEVTPAQRDGVLLLALTLAITAAQYLFYNVTFVQHQGRYLFPALIPISFVVALGLDGWIRPLGERFHLPMAVRWIPPAVVWLGFAALDVYALVRVVVPSLTP